MKQLLLVALLASACNDKNAGNAQAAENGHKDFLQIEPNSPRMQFIKVEAVQETSAGTQVNLPGKVGFDEDHTQRVATPIDGRVTSLLVKVGDKVKASQALLELTSPQVGQMQADALKSQHDLDIAQKALDRSNKLKPEGAVSDKDAAQAEADYKKARADVARTAAQLKALGIGATDPAVRVALRAQIGGTVVDRPVLVGQEVRADQANPLLTITSLEVVWVQADVYEQDLALVQPGATVTATVPAYPDEKFEGKVGNVGEVVDPQTRTVKVRCVIPNPDHKLKPEMFAKVIITDTGDHKRLMIPAKAVLSDGEKSKVVLALEDRKFKTRVIKVGPESDGQVRVLDGLRVGEKIVTDGALFLKQEIEEQ
jgi:cobalt-zinc-cadmium efflux system membrane fusion protein